MNLHKLLDRPDQLISSAPSPTKMAPFSRGRTYNQQQPKGPLSANLKKFLIRELYNTKALQKS